MDSKQDLLSFVSPVLFFWALVGCCGFDFPSSMDRENPWDPIFLPADAGTNYDDPPMEWYWEPPEEQTWLEEV